MTSNAHDLTERLRRRLETERQAIEELTAPRVLGDCGGSPPGPGSDMILDGTATAGEGYLSSREN